MDERFAPLFTPPYYAVIFTNQLAENSGGYPEMSQQMAALAAQQPGFLGVETTRDSNGLGITISYWETENAIAKWKAQIDHIGAQKLGKTRWYAAYTLRIAKVERNYCGPEGR